jgi:hypothetical protein
MISLRLFDSFGKVLYFFRLATQPPFQCSKALGDFVVMDGDTDRPATTRQDTQFASPGDSRIK